MNKIANIIKPPSVIGQYISGVIEEATSNRNIYQLAFVKEEDGGWYIDLPSWTGAHANLAMVAGSDLLLDFLLKSGYLTMVDEDFARQQYEAMKKHLRHEASLMGKKAVGVKEYLRQNPEFKMAPGDAGLVIKGISAGGTAFAIGAATYFGDWEFRSQMLRTAEVAGGTVKEDRKHHYRLAEMFLVGEATALAMRTNVKR